jgi:uncharacterized protein (TIGR00369 family)
MLRGMTQTRRELIQAFVPNSPLVGLLGIELAEVETDRAVLRLPFRPELATMGDVVHGGAIAALLDTASMAAAWSDDTVPEALAGATVSMSVDYVAAARGVDLTATGRAVRRGRSLCFCEVEVTQPDGGVIAKGLAVHRFG